MGGGRPVGKQWPTADAGGDRVGHFAVNVAELAGGGSRRDGAIEGDGIDRLSDAIASGPGVGDYAFEA